MIQSNESRPAGDGKGFAINGAYRVGGSFVGSITDEGHEPPLTRAQAEELDRRLQEHRQNPHTGIPWEQVKAELERKGLMIFRQP